MLKANPTIIIIAMGKLFVSQNLDTIMQQIHIIKILCSIHNKTCYIQSIKS